MDWHIGIDLRAARPAAHTVRQMRSAVDLVLEHHRERAGATGVRLLDADAATLAADPRVLAMLGPFRSADTAAALPIINRYGTPIVSASNTYVPLTRHGPSFEPDEPERYYAHGPRTYVRLFPNDFHQGAALVQAAISLGVKRPFILHDNAPYGLVLYQGFERAASAAGLSLAGITSWHNQWLEHVARADTDALVLCGVFDEQLHGVIEEKIRRFGPDDDVKVLGGDVFLTGESLGAAAAGMIVLAPGVRPGHLPEAAEEFVHALSRHLQIKPDSVEPYAVHAAEAVTLLLEAINSAGFSRASLVERLFDGTRHDGMLGGYTILPGGDIAADGGPILGFSLYRASRTGAFVLEGSVVPSSLLANAAMG